MPVWLHDSILLYAVLALVLDAPLIPRGYIGVHIYHLRPIVRAGIQDLLLCNLLGLPLWIGVCLYAEFATTSATRAIDPSNRASTCPTARVALSEGSENFSSPQVETTRHSDDIFVHRILGLAFLGFGTGDIEIRFSTPGSGQRVYVLKNVWRAARVEREINRMIA